MPLLRSQQHVDQLLAGVSVRYRPAELIADKVFPSVPVKKDSDLFRTYTRNFRLPETRRANHGKSNEHQLEVGTSPYVLERHALKEFVSDDDADNFDVGDLRSDTTEELTDAILRRREHSASLTMTTTSWSLGVSLAAGAAFSDNTTTSNPIPVFDTAQSTIISNSGVMANKGILPRAAFVSVKNHVSVLDRTKFTGRDMSPAIIASLFDLQELLVPAANYDTAAQGQASSLSNFWTHAWIGMAPAKAGPKVMSAGYIFEKATPLVKRWWDNERDAEAIEVEQKYQVRVVASLCGYLIKGV